MNRTELEELIRSGENSGVEFKRDDVIRERLAKELAALLNLRGGHLLLGVEDDGTVTGLTRAPELAEEWIMEVARVHLRPAAIPFWEALMLDDGKRRRSDIASRPDAPDKPYKAKRSSAWVTQVRVGHDYPRCDGRRGSASLHAVRAPTVRPQAGTRRDVRRPRLATPGELLP